MTDLHPKISHVCVLLIGREVTIFPSKEDEKLLPLIAERMEKNGWTSIRISNLNDDGASYLILEADIPESFARLDVMRRPSLEALRAWRELVNDSVKAMGIWGVVGVPD